MVDFIKMKFIWPDFCLDNRGRFTDLIPHKDGSLSPTLLVANGGQKINGGRSEGGRFQVGTEGT
ncbi:MAG: hypothetical protein DRG63_03585 [Deltaproteobacteria bacterium]|nr:MAG: hypothetical protein DRG63_03585 [Deltaproteobacteria bacterium]